MKSNALSKLEKEWLAFQKVEHARQQRELDKRINDGPIRENKEERKLREVIFDVQCSRNSSDVRLYKPFSYKKQ